MSLINDMLKDLSKQQNASYQVIGDLPLDENPNQLNDQRLFNQSSVAKPLGRKWLPSVVIFVAVFVGVMAEKLFFSETASPKFSEPKVIQAELPTLEKQAGEAIESPLTTVTSPSAPSQSASVTALPIESLPVNNIDTPIISQVNNRQRELEIYDLLDQASRAFALDRLTSPIGDNAYAHYQKILLLDKSHPAALQGVNKIAVRYLNLAAARLENADYDRAQIFIERAKWVAPDHPQIATYLDQLERRTRPVVNSNTAVSATVLPAPETQTEPLRSQALAPPDKPTSESITEPFATDTASPSLSVAPNPGWQDQSIVEQAQGLVAQDNTQAAIRLLRDYIFTAANSAATTRMLLDIYYQQNMPDEMQKLLADAPSLDALEQTFQRAKIALLKNQPAEAIELLETQIAAAERHENYRALLARLYQDAGRYPESSNSYRRLINAFGDKPAYWLGFALALDAQNQQLSALHAFQRLAEFHDLQIEVRRYIEQRIAALAPSSGIEE